MQALRPQIRRISPLRPLRPPSYLLLAVRPRVFTTRAPLLLVSRAGPRPQLPFLTPPFARRHVLFAIRPLSTEYKAYIRYQLRLGAYWTVIGWVVLGALASIYFVLRQDWLNRQYPAPEEWGWQLKYAWRKGRHEEDEEAFGRGITDWGTVGLSFRTVILYCEKGSMVRAWAKPLPHNENWDRSIPGTDPDEIAREPISPLTETEKVGYDVSDKSEPWRRAYFHALMAIAKTAEMNVGWVRDRRRHLLFPAEQMVGPSNPYPKPLWPGSPPAPLEEDCEQAYDPPNLWYVRILTTAGFTVDQRLAAALAYASWLDYSGDPTTASALYDWSLDLANSSSNNATSSLLNPTTGIIPATAPYTTTNILSACTALASHKARAGALAPALNIYLSVLRARRAAPSAPPSLQYPPKGPDLSLTSVDSVLRWLTSLPFRAPMAPPPPPGDTAFMRTAASECEDAALMGYVGEILFASSSGAKGKREALGWTRDAVAVAEKGSKDGKMDVKGRRVCTQCLGSGLENWYKMVGVLAREEGDGATGMGQRGVIAKEPMAARGWSFWAPFGSGERGLNEGGVVDGEEEGEWKREEEMVAKRRAAFAEARLMETLNRHITLKSNWFVV